MDLRTKLVLALVAASLLSMLVLGAIAYGMADRGLTERAERQLRSLAEAKGEDLENVVEGWEDRVALIASRTQLRQSLEDYNRTGQQTHQARILQILLDARQASDAVSALVVYDREGRPVIWTGRDPGSGPPPPLRDSSLRAVPDTIRFEGISFRNGQPPVVHFMAPLATDGRWIGALRASLRTRDLVELTANPTGLGRTGETMLAMPDSAGRFRVLAPGLDSAAVFDADAVDDGGDGPVHRALRGQEGPFTEGLRDYRGEEVWAAARVLPELGWVVVVKFDADEEREAIVGFREQLVMVGFSLSAFAILFGVLLGLRFAKPIHDLSEVANRVRMGELGARARVDREDELGLLALTFNEMAEELENRMDLLREYEKFFEVSPDMLCIAGTDGYFKRINPAFERILGWSEDELLGRPFAEFVHPDDVEKTRRETERLAEGNPTISFENRYRRPDGSYRRIHWTCYPDPDTGLLYAVARQVSESAE